VADADLLLHVIDYSSGSYCQETAEVEATLTQIDAGDGERMEVLNKIDLLNGQPQAPYHAAGATEVVAVSAKTGTGLDRLIEAITERAGPSDENRKRRRSRTARARVHWE
jgi:GTP-binding protein HflX